MSNEYSRRYLSDPREPGRFFFSPSSQAVLTSAVEAAYLTDGRVGRMQVLYGLAAQYPTVFEKYGMTPDALAEFIMEQNLGGIKKTQLPMIPDHEIPIRFGDPMFAIFVKRTAAIDGRREVEPADMLSECFRVMTNGMGKIFQRFGIETGDKRRQLIREFRQIIVM